MHRIELKGAKGWQKSSDGSDSNPWMRPESIDARCGYCNRQGALMTGSEVTFNDKTKTATFSGRCTHCDRESTVLMVSAVKLSQWQKGTKPKEFWVLPAPNYRELRFTEEDIDNRRVFRGYRDAIDSFNDGKPSPAISACGQVIEGIGKTKFPNAENARNIGRLFDKLRGQLKSVPDAKQVLMPVIQLGEALRLGRNPGSHFFLETDPDMELAEKVIDLTEFLIEYIYTISKEAEKVEGLIAKCGPLDSEENHSECPE